MHNRINATKVTCNTAIPGKGLRSYFVNINFSPDTGDSAAFFICPVHHGECLFALSQAKKSVVSRI